MPSSATARASGPYWLLAIATLLCLALVWLRFGLAEPNSYASLPLTPELPDPGPMPDFREFTQVDDRKDAFFGYLLPVVEAQNDWLVEARAFLKDQYQVLQSGQSPTDPAMRRLLALSERYRIVLSDPPEPVELEELLQRVDLIPPSLALAQAAAESGWGTSRFAREGNNLFGEWCFREGCGMVPQRRRGGAQHEVASFDSVSGAIDSYFRNLNTHPAYASMRELRANAREQQGKFIGPDLVPGLLMYSERREYYLDEILAMIRINRLVELDEEQLPFFTDAEADRQTAQR